MYDIFGMRYLCVVFAVNVRPRVWGALFLQRARRANESHPSDISLRAHGRDHLLTSATEPGSRLGAIFILDMTMCRRRLLDLGQGQVQYSSAQVFRSASAP